MVLLPLPVFRLRLQSAAEENAQEKPQHVHDQKQGDCGCASNRQSQAAQMTKMSAKSLSAHFLHGCSEGLRS